MSRPLDIEYLAFRAGLKPAIRLSAEPGRGDAIAERYASLGCAIARGTGLIFIGQRELLLEFVYVAHTQADADGLRDAEVPTLQPEDTTPLEVALKATREVGLRLGYPACCVDVCCARLKTRRALIKVGNSLGTASQAYHAVRDAWVPAPRWQLNDLLFTVRKSILSFEPCSYACDTATRYADAVLEVIEEMDPVARESIERALKRSLAVNMRGARAAVTLTRTPKPVIARAEPLRDDHGRMIDEAHERLAPQLIGASVGSRGQVRHMLGQQAVVVEFR